VKQANLFIVPRAPRARLCDNTRQGNSTMTASPRFSHNGFRVRQRVPPRGERPSAAQVGIAGREGKRFPFSDPWRHRGELRGVGVARVRRVVRLTQENESCKYKCKKKRKKLPNPAGSLNPEPAPTPQPSGKASRFPLRNTARSASRSRWRPWPSASPGCSSFRTDGRGRSIVHANGMGAECQWHGLLDNVRQAAQKKDASN
jgi:hypothetical protein